VDVYREVTRRVGTADALELTEELRDWHDAMVAHERMLTRFGHAPDGCGPREDCEHARAADLWERAVAILGPHARDLAFLRRSATAFESQPASLSALAANQ
jgi:hypothetical protein